MTQENPNVSCCFCGQSLLFEDAVQISICLTTNIEEEQGLFSHLSCLDNALDKSVPRLLDKFLNVERSTNTQHRIGDSRG